MADKKVYIIEDTFQSTAFRTDLVFFFVCAIDTIKQFFDYDTVTCRNGKHKNNELRFGYVSNCLGLQAVTEALCYV